MTRGPYLCYLVASILGLVVLLCVAGEIILPLYGQQVPDGLKNLAFMCGGALASLLAAANGRPSQELKQ